MVRQLDITAHDIYCKPGNTSLLKGIDKSFLDKVEQLNGVESITYSCFESMRNWIMKKWVQDVFQNLHPIQKIK